MIKNLLLDLGGVLVSLDKEEAVRRFVSLGLYDAEELLDPYRQSGLFLALEKGEIDPASFLKEVNQSYSLDLRYEEMEYAFLGFLKKVEEEKFSFLQNVIRPKGIRIYCISNTNSFISDSPSPVAGKKIKEYLADYFDDLFFSYQEHSCKPEKKLFDTLLERTGIDPKETLFLDDAPANTAFARSMGFVTYRPANGENWCPLINKMIGDLV